METDFDSSTMCNMFMHTQTQTAQTLCSYFHISTPLFCTKSRLCKYYVKFWIKEHVEGTKHSTNDCLVS